MVTGTPWFVYGFASESAANPHCQLITSEARSSSGPEAVSCIKVV